MRRLLMALISLSLFGCGPGSEKTLKPIPVDEVYSVRLEELYRLYAADRNDRTYLRQLVKVRLEPRRYTIVPANDSSVPHLEAYQVMPGVAAFVHFECPVLPANNNSPILVVGTVKECVTDGVHRSARVNYYLRVVNCSLFVEPP